MSTDALFWGDIDEGIVEGHAGGIGGECAQVGGQAGIQDIEAAGLTGALHAQDDVRGEIRAESDADGELPLFVPDNGRMQILKFESFAHVRMDIDHRIFRQNMVLMIVLAVDIVLGMGRQEMERIFWVG